MEAGEDSGAEGQSSKATDTEPTLSAAPMARPALARSPASNPNFSSLPPLTTSLPSRLSAAQKKPSYADKRLSALSSNSLNAHNSSRPQSNTFPVFFSSLPYALVRDFAYPIYNQLHYGPAPDQASTVSTPGSERHRRTSDPLSSLRAGSSRFNWPVDDESTDASYFGMQLPARSYGDTDGPPYAEDADLLSPIVTSTKHKKSKSNIADYNRNVNSNATNASRLDPVEQGGGVRLPNGQISEHNVMEDLLDQQSSWRNNTGNLDHIPDPQGNTHLPTVDGYIHSDYVFHDYDEEDEESRFSRAYQFTIASPDEEFHGKAVALFDFERENDNELPFVEGQVLWVSYRHGEGWLVAQDPKTRECGLIPEEYVRLLRDIEGGLKGLNGGDPSAEDDADFDTPIDPRRPGFYSAEHRPGFDYDRERFNSGQHYPPVVSHFTTSSKDLEPYPVNQSATVGNYANLSSPTSTSQLNTPMPTDQSRFSGHTFFNVGDEEDDINNNNASGVGSATGTVTENGGGELLSPETFKRETVATTKDEKARDSKQVANLNSENSGGNAVTVVEALI